MSTSEASMTCTQCRVTSSLKAAFHESGRGKKKRVLCPYCMREESHRESQRSFISLGALVLLGSLVAWFGDTTNPGWLLLNLALLSLMAWVTVLPHEAGHAFAAHLVGLEVYRIVLGVGRKLATVMLLGVPVEVRQYPMSGTTHIAIREVPHIRWKWAFIVFAGPLVNILFLWAAIVGGEALWKNENIQGGFTPVCAFIVANFLIVVGNLWPGRVASDTGAVPTDGGQLLALATGKSYDFVALARSQNAARLQLLYERGQWEDIEREAQRMLADSPDDYAVQVNLSAALINLGKLDLARSLLEQMIERSPPFEWQGAIAANNLAWVYVLHDDAALADRAVALAAKAYAVVPWEPSVTSTYGSAHALYGDPEIAVRMLTSERVRKNAEKTRASSLCGLAIAYARNGRIDEARTATMLAQSIHAEAQLLEVARRKVDALADARAGTPL